MWLARHHFVLRLEQLQTKTKCLKVIHFIDTPVTTAKSKGNCDAGVLVIGGSIYAPIHP
jgi:hypothetical protein